MITKKLPQKETLRLRKPRAAGKTTAWTRHPGPHLCRELRQLLYELPGLLLDKLLTGRLQVMVHVLFRVKVMLSDLRGPLKKMTFPPV